MKNMIRLVCLLLALASLLCACQTGSSPSSTTTTATTQPTTANTLFLDPYRALPTLAEKFVTDAPAEGDLVLAKDGVANATILYPQGNSKALSAAQNLADYLQKITGAAFSPVSDDQPLPAGNLILVGPTAKTIELGIGPYTGYPNGEKLSVIRKDNCLILCGNDDAIYTGTQNAVTYFLEEAGCGWYGDDALWQIVPNHPTLAVTAVNKIYTPAISGREISNVGSMKTNWYLGGDSFAAGHGLWRWGGKSKYAQHPEWFALVNGSRDPNSVEWWQYCYTNEEFAQNVAAGLTEYFNKNPYVTSYSIASNDGWYEGWCECDTCTAAGNQADQYMIFANRVAEIVAQTHPDRQISFLAYHATFPAPTKAVKAHPILEIRFCIETNPMDDLMADRQIHSGFNSINKLEYSQSWLGNVQEWIEKTQLQHTSIWGWYCIDDQLYGWNGAPWIQGNVASRNVELFRQLGIDTVFYDGSYQKNSMPLRWSLYYPFAKCMYFGDLTGEEVLYDACQKLYGEAADEMFLFYRILADSAQESASPSGVNWVPAPLLDVYGNNYNLIQQTVKDARAKLDLLTPEQKERVENQLRGWMYVELYI